MPVLLYLLCELIAWSWLGPRLGFWASFLQVVGSFLVGLFLVKAFSLHLMGLKNKEQLGMQLGNRVIHGVVQVVGALLLLLPGVVSDGLGLLLILPGFRHLLIWTIYLRVLKWMQTKTRFANNSFVIFGHQVFQDWNTHSQSRRPQQEDFIDVTAVKVDPETNRLMKKPTGGEKA